LLGRRPRQRRPRLGAGGERQRGRSTGRPGPGVGGRATGGAEARPPPSPARVTLAVPRTWPADSAGHVLRTWRSGREAGLGQHLVELADDAVEEGAELGVDGGRLVEAHRVHAVLQVVRMDGEEGDPPFVVVEAGRARHQLEDAAPEATPGPAVALHELLAALVG